MSDFRIYDIDLTAAQVLADYTNIAPVIAQSRTISPVPWLWTQDGDGVVDDITDADQAAYAVAGGIVGDVPTNPTVFANTSSLDLICGSYAHDVYIPQNYLYSSKTVSVDNVSTIYNNWSLSRVNHTAIAGRKLYIFNEVQDAGTGTLTAFHMLTAADFSILSVSESYTIDPPVATNYYTYVLTGLTIPEPDARVNYPTNSSTTIVLRATRSVATAADVISNAVLLFDNVAAIDCGNYGYCLFKGRNAKSVNVASSKIQESFPAPWSGDDFDLTPGKINHLFFAATSTVGGQADWSPVAIIEFTYSPIYTSA
jgi:hypothetical protein